MLLSRFLLKEDSAYERGHGLRHLFLLVLPGTEVAVALVSQRDPVPDHRQQRLQVMVERLLRQDVTEALDEPGAFQRVTPRVEPCKQNKIARFIRC